MRVTIDEIKEAGLRRTWDVPRDQLDDILSGDRAGYRARGPAHVDARLERLERRVRIAGSAKAEVEVACGRCLAPVPLEVATDFELTLVPDDKGGVDTEGERDARQSTGSFAPEQADEETYSGKTIELDPIVREQILLALPGYPVCKESCRGLCTVCGANLNEGECGCDRRVPDPRWAGLKDFKLQ
jgi:uncharacterized protein